MHFHIWVLIHIPTYIHVQTEPQSSEVIAFQSALLSLGVVHRLVKLLLLVGRSAAERALVLLSRLVCIYVLPAGLFMDEVSVNWSNYSRYSGCLLL